jgi:hypothetical protein
MIKYRLNNQVSSGIVRATAGQVLLISVMEIYYSSIWLLSVILFDFAVRVLNQGRYSPLALSAKKWIVPTFNLENYPIALKPKRFAAGIGLSLAGFSLLFLVMGYDMYSYVVLGILAFFSFLESVFGFCAGCKIYGLLIKYKIIKDDECLECEVKYNKTE